MDGYCLCKKILTFSFDEKYFEQLATELNKGKAYDFDAITVINAYMYSLVHYFTYITSKNTENLHIKELNTDDIYNLTQFVQDFFINIPFTYNVMFTLKDIYLPCFDTTGKFKITSGISDGSGLVITPSSENINSKIIITKEGYYLPYDNSYFIKEPIQDLFVLLYLLKDKNIIKHNLFKKSA